MAYTDACMMLLQGHGPEPVPDAAFPWSFAFVRGRLLDQSEWIFGSRRLPFLLCGIEAVEEGRSQNNSIPEVGKIIKSHREPAVYERLMP
jgi:hypothetical protein